MKAHIFAAAMLAASLVLPLAPVRAAEVVDQSMTRVSPDNGVFVIGPGQITAQTVKAGRDGQLVAVRLPVECGSEGELAIHIGAVGADGLPLSREGPSTIVRASAIPPLQRTNGQIGLNIFRLAQPRLMRAGDLFSIALSQTGDGVFIPFSRCFLFASDPGNLYPDGERFVGDTQASQPWRRPTPEDNNNWLDIAFETIVETGAGSEGANACVIDNTPQPWIPASSGACRCLRDPGLRELRCRYAFPNIAVFRRIPLGIRPGKRFREKWSLLPLVPFDGPARLSLPGLNGGKPRELLLSGGPFELIKARSGKIKAPLSPVPFGGVATLSAGGQTFRLDRSILAEQFSPLPAKKP